MVVYYDLIFLINFIYQFGVFGITNRILHMGASILRIIFAAIAGCVAYVLTIVFIKDVKEHYILIFLVSLIADTIISAFAFRLVSIKQLVNTILTEIGICFCLAGVLGLLNNFLQNSYLLLTGAMAVVFLVLTIYTIRNIFVQHALNRETIVSVVLKQDDNICNSYGLLDSGNTLSDPISGKPVCIMTIDLFQKLFPDTDVHSLNGYRVIPYCSVGKSNGIMEAFFLETMEVKKKEKISYYHHVLCAICRDSFSSGAKYEMILHPKAVI
ncbi:MAG: sigma-E processing peptidase SpoIIGA [Lachnospiraceae bacterium]|nr:sigma-E processing peptidase SpoIIGA [Lachnospiraceae bacterium]